MINKMEFDGAAKDKIEVVSVVSQVLAKQKQKPTKVKKASGKGEKTIGNRDNSSFNGETQLEIEFEIGEIERALTAKIVKKCGNRTHWEDWANDVAKIANTHIERINTILANPQNTQERSVFNAFLNELRDDLNNAITENEAVEMLAQHLITKPVFDALFANDNFTQHNPMSQAMQKVVDIFEQKNLATETKQLKEFYESIQFRVKNIQSPEGKQKIIKELYDSFFNKAFPKMAERLGIVYTPVEVVDFIIRSVEDVLNNEFNASLADKGVQIIDPFTGTGTFITRLLQSGIIPPEKLPLKYHEIHANEIVLLAYYIAAINIESVYHALLSENVANSNENSTSYQPFEGICLTDTFQMYEKEDLVDEILQVNSDRRKRQKALDIQVIIGNPPYSVGQTSANDNNANIAYPHLDEQIRSTYAEYSTSTNKNALYDSYIRAIRWASDRIGDNGVIGFITNAGFISSNTADGLRKCLAEEFTHLYIFHMRGNSRISGDRARKEGGNIFDIRTPTAISILVKNSNAKQRGQIYFHDIGDYLKKEQKLEIIEDFQSINGISAQNGWTQIIPDQFNDWLNQRDPNFENYLSMGDKKDKSAVVIFENYSRGIATARDAWCYNASYNSIDKNMSEMIAFYDLQLKQFNINKENNDELKVNDFIDRNPLKISWSGDLILRFGRSITSKFSRNNIVSALYRPYSKQNLYFDKIFNERLYQLPNIFPEKSIDNKVICLTVTGGKGFSTIMTDITPDLHLIGDSQCFPLYLYEKEENNENYQRRDAITDEALTHFKAAYPNEDFDKEDMFYYIYGLLHSEEYREKYADNLSKQLPRIPCVKSTVDFWAFSQAGRELAELHLNYETVPMYQNALFKGGLKLLNDQISGGVGKDFYVEKMKFGKKIDEETGKKVDDKTTIIYNSQFTLANIPEEAYDYVVNGKPALEWVMERQSVKTDKASGIVNDANDWAIETMNTPRYPMELFLRVVTASLETMRIVRALPKLNI